MDVHPGSYYTAKQCTISNYAKPFLQCTLSNSECGHFLYTYFRNRKSCPDDGITIENAKLFYIGQLLTFSCTLLVIDYLYMDVLNLGLLTYQGRTTTRRLTMKTFEIVNCSVNGAPHILNVGFSFKKPKHSLLPDYCLGIKLFE